MAKHDVWFSVPSRPLAKSDVEFEVWSDGTKLGTLQVSKGSLVWYPNKTSYGYRLGWETFHELMQENATSFEKR